MPEGPEVKIVATQLDEKFKEQILVKINILSGPYATKSDDRYKMFRLATKKFTKAQLTSVQTKGKTMYWELTPNGKTVVTKEYIIIGFGLTGGFTYIKGEHTRIEFIFNDSQGQSTSIYYDDVRNFGNFNFATRETLNAKLNTMGPDIFTITLDDNGKRFFFPTPDYLASPLNYTALQITSILKTCKTFGFTLSNSLPMPEQNSINTPDFLYTPYIDIYSDALTNYQKLKDSDSSTIKRKGLIARLYLSGVGNPQITTNTRNNTYDEDGNLIGYNYTSAALGSQPFVLTFDLNSPKVVGWSRDTAINSLDFQQRDCYGDFLFSAYSSGVPGTTSENFNSEFQMTLLCIEG